MNVGMVLQSALCEHIRIHLAVAGNKVKRISGIDLGSLHRTPWYTEVIYLLRKQYLGI